MAKNRKKKSSANVPHSMLKTSISKSQFDSGCAIAQKTMHFLGFDPALFDMFTKKQKHAVIDIERHSPLIRAKEGNSVPRKYVYNVRTSILEFMRTTYIDEKAQLTYIDFFTYGVSFMFVFRSKYGEGIFTDAQKEAFVDKMADKFGSFQTVNVRLFNELYTALWFELGFYSQMNFRTYGFELTVDMLSPKEITCMETLRYVIELTSYENESIYFINNDIKRKAFCVINSGIYSKGPLPVTVKHREIYPESKSLKVYKMYIQSHAIHRFKERTDIADALLRNYLINSSLTASRVIVKCPNGQHFICCYMANILIGYFAYIIQGDKLFILSFLPLVSQITPEGEKLYRILNLGKEELIYLGMDKLNFYVSVDFDEIPMLKNALVESGIWHIKTELDKSPACDKPIDRTKTQFVKNFFEKMETSRMQLLSENV
jgi:hypothetical protein